MIIFLSSGTWTCPTGVTVIYVEGLGGGSGGGGGGNVSYSGTYYGGEGGLAAVLQGPILLPVTAGDIYNVVIGVGGTGGAGGAGSDGAAGGTGGNTYFKDPSNSILLAFPGQSTGAVGSEPNPIPSNGSNSQSPTLVYYIGGLQGTAGSGGGSGCNAGSGGSAGPNGNGGNGGNGRGSGSPVGASAPNNSGAGGGGGGANNITTAGAGGAGGSGLLIISYDAGSGFTAGGDLVGSSTDQTVIGIQTIPVASTVPTSNQVLEYNGDSNKWTPTALPSSLPPSGAAGGDLSGTYPNPTVATSNGNTIITAVTTAGGNLSGSYPNPVVVSINGTSVPSSPTSNQVLVATSSSSAIWEQISNAEIANAAAIAVSKLATSTNGYVLQINGSGTPTWTLISGDASISAAGNVTILTSNGHTIVTSATSAGGDLGGTYPSPEVTGILNHTLPGLSDGYLNWNGSSWVFSSIGSGFTAGGDLSGTSTNQTVTGIQTIPVSSTTPTTGQVLQYNGSQYVPTASLGPSQALTWTSLTSNGWTNLYQLTPSLALNEVLNIAVSVNMASNNGQDGYSALWTRRFFGMQNVGGTLSDPVGNTSDENSVTPIIGAYLTGAAAQIAISGSNVLVQAQRPTGMTGLYAAVTVDLVRGAPSSGPSIVSVSPNIVAAITASPTTITVTLSSGAATGATAITVDGVSLTSITVTSSTTVTGVLAAGTYSAGTGNVTVTSPLNPSALINGFTFAAATLTALSSPLLASASGDGQSITLQGTNLNGVSSVLVGSTSATSLSSTSTSVTFTVPANTASATPYNVTFTGTFGSATLTGALYSIPGSITHCWYAPQYNAAAGTWTDLVGGTALAVGAGSYTKPTLTSSWTNSQPGVTYGGTNGLINTSVPSGQTQPASIFAVYNATATTTYNMIAYGGVSGTGIFAMFQVSGSHNISIQAGGSSFNSTLATSSTPQFVEGYLNGASSSVTLGNSTTQTGTTSAGNDTGFCIGARYDGGATIASGLIGSVGLVALYSGTPSSGDRTLLHSISIAIWAVA